MRDAEDGDKPSGQQALLDAAFDLLNLSCGKESGEARDDTQRV